MSNPNFLTANANGIELMPGVNDEAQGYDVNRIIQALNGTNLVPITTGNLTVTGNETVSGTLAVTGAVTFSSLIGPITINPGPLDIIGPVNTSATPGSWTQTLIVDDAATSTQNITEFRVAGTRRASVRVDGSGNIVINPSGVGALYLGPDEGTGGTNAYGGINVQTGNLTITAGSIIASGSIQSNNNGVISQGSSGGLQFSDRTGTAPTPWLWYASGGITRLWNITNGDRLQMDGSGNTTMYGSLSIPPSVGGTMSTTSYGTVPVKIAETLLNAGAGSITFSSIPSGFRHLLLQWYSRSDTVATTANTMIRINADTGANYDYQVGSFSGTTAAAAEAETQTLLQIGEMPAASATASYFEAGEAKILDYGGTSGDKQVFAQSGRWTGNAAGNGKIFYSSGKWRTTNAAINRIDFLASAGNLVTNTLVTLWGLP